MGKTLRKFIALVAGLAFLAAWAGTIITYLSTDSIAAFTIALTIAALATEILIWVAAILGGWTMFANRRALWQRLTGQRKQEGV